MNCKSRKYSRWHPHRHCLWVPLVGMHCSCLVATVGKSTYHHYCSRPQLLHNAAFVYPEVCSGYHPRKEKILRQTPSLVGCNHNVSKKGNMLECYPQTSIQSTVLHISSNNGTLTFSTALHACLSSHGTWWPLLLLPLDLCGTPTMSPPVDHHPLIPIPRDPKHLDAK